MRFIFSAVAVCFGIAASGSADAWARTHITIRTSGADIRVEGFAANHAGPRPAVLILSGSRGFSSPAYDAIGQEFAAAGLDVYLVHVLTPADLDVLAKAGNVRARLEHAARRLPDWRAGLRAAVVHFKAEPRHAGQVGVLGISLGAQIAAAAAVDMPEIRALVLVSGGFPNGFSQPIRFLPPVHLIWGGADRVFPPRIGQELLGKARALGGAASLSVHEGAAHDFFLKPETHDAKAAHSSAAAFFRRHLTGR